jgi:hypothetical protein
MRLPLRETYAVTEAISEGERSRVIVNAVMEFDSAQSTDALNAALGTQGTIEVSSEDILSECDGNIPTITLNRPAEGNG